MGKRFLTGLLFAAVFNLMADPAWSYVALKPGDPCSTPNVVSSGPTGIDHPYLVLSSENLICYFPSDKAWDACIKYVGAADLYNGSGIVTLASSESDKRSNGCYTLHVSSSGSGSSGGGSSNNGSGANFVSSIAWNYSGQSNPQPFPLAGQSVQVTAHVKSGNGGQLSRLTYVRLEISGPDGGKTINFSTQSPVDKGFTVSASRPGTVTIKASASIDPNALIPYGSMSLDFKEVPQAISYSKVPLSGPKLTFSGKCTNVEKVVLNLDGVDNPAPILTNGHCDPWTMSGVALPSPGRHTVVFHSGNNKVATTPVTYNCSATGCN